MWRLPQQDSVPEDKSMLSSVMPVQVEIILRVFLRVSGKAVQKLIRNE
jgi:hypothetical protein